MTKKKKPVVKIAVIMAEGETEVEFYNCIIDTIKSQVVLPKELKIHKIVNIEGISKFQKNAVSHFNTIQNKYEKKYPNFKFDFYIFLCIDTDVFYFEQKPPLNKEKLKQDLFNNGAVSVKYIEADKSIEDWFLSDLEGIKNFLKLKNISPGYKNRKTGAEKLNEIFKKANKTYIKGCKVEGFAKKLNISMIMKKYKNELSPLFDLLGYNE